MTKEKFFEVINNGQRVSFNGNVAVDSIWDGCQDLYYYAQYADKDGIHACPEDSTYDVDCFEPLGFDEITDELLDELLADFYMYAFV